MLWNDSSNIEDKSHNLAKIIKEAAEIINHTNDSNKRNKNKTYSKETVKLINDRRNMKIKIMKMKRKK